MSPGKKDPAKQNHRTPEEFIKAVERRFGRIAFDLAATDGDEVGPLGCRFTPEQDSLKQDWTEAFQEPGSSRVVFLNPPFANIRPWVKKLDEECQELSRWTLCLVPYSAGAKWWSDHVHGKCVVYSVGRMRFVGQEWVFPKDLALLAFGFGASGFVPLWDWRK